MLLFTTTVSTHLLRFSIILNDEVNLNDEVKRFAACIFSNPKTDDGCAQMPAINNGGGECIALHRAGWRLGYC